MSFLEACCSFVCCTTVCVALQYVLTVSLNTLHSLYLEQRLHNISRYVMLHLSSSYNRDCVTYCHLDRVETQSCDNYIACYVPSATANFSSKGMVSRVASLNIRILILKIAIQFNLQNLAYLEAQLCIHANMHLCKPLFLNISFLGLKITPERVQLFLLGSPLSKTLCCASTTDQQNMLSSGMYVRPEYEISRRKIKKRLLLLLLN